MLVRSGIRSCQKLSSAMGPGKANKTEVCQVRITTSAVNTVFSF